MRLFSALVTLLVACGFDARAQLLHRYLFETTGSANDTVGTANGTIYGSATVTSGALTTTGAAGGLSGGVPQNSVGLPASAVAGITNTFSIEAWYSTSYNGGNCTLFSFSDGTTANYLLATPARGTSPYQSDAAAKGSGANASEQLANQIYCDTGLLHDMALTYDGTNVTYYLDGALATYSSLQNSFTDSGFNLSSLTTIGIAGGSPYSDNTIKGNVYDFRIYGQALTQNQMAAIYALGTNASNASISGVLTNAPQLTSTTPARCARKATAISFTVMAREFPASLRPTCATGRPRRPFFRTGRRRGRRMPCPAARRIIFGRRTWPISTDSGTSITPIRNGARLIPPSASRLRHR